MNTFGNVQNRANGGGSSNASPLTPSRAAVLLKTINPQCSTNGVISNPIEDTEAAVVKSSENVYEEISHVSNKKT